MAMRRLKRRFTFGASGRGNVHEVMIKLDRLRPRPCTAGAAVALQLFRRNRSGQRRKARL
jgi:hypothetical protein